VTRHVPEELGNDDWNTMVLHYLGLDHIGHKAGPRRLHSLTKVISNELTSLQPKYDP
jgi:ethanolaminephosphotransferase